MDKSDSSRADDPGKDDSGPVKGAFGRKMVMGMLIFWVLVVIVFIVFRYPFIFSQLIGGGEDRALLAVESAEINGSGLNIVFRRSQPDQPVGVFIVAGHVPAMSLRSSNPELANNLNDNHLTINGATFEIIYETVDLNRLPDRQDGLTIDWQGRERGTIRVELADTFALEEVNANRAFLVIARNETDFRATNIIHN